MTKRNKIIIIVSGVVIVGILAVVTIRYYEQRSIAGAVESVNRLFVGKGIKDMVTIEEDVRGDYNSFMAVYSPSAIKLIFASPLYGRYDFIVSARPIRPFIITLRNGGHKKDYWIHRRGIDNAMKLIR